MAYRLRIWEFLNSKEYEYTYMGNYGAKGEKRAPRVKITPEQIMKQNMTNRKNHVRRLIKNNFGPGDYWITLKYPKGTRKSVAEVRKDIEKFIANMRNAYKRKGEQFKYIFRVEIGKLGGIHIHIILNRCKTGTATDVLVERYWKAGRPNFALLYEDGGYDQLASYLAKPQLEGQEEDEYLKRFHPSRNLVKPVPKEKEYKHWTVRKLINEGPKATEGFYIEQDTVVVGVNPYTGMSYMKYTETRIRPEKRGDSG